MPQPRIEYTNLSAEFQVAEQDAGTATIVGHAAVWNTLTNPQDPRRMIIRPGAFARTLRERPDVVALWNHLDHLVLGRTTAGTLRLQEDEKGLRVEFTPPNSPTGKDALESIRRGDVDQMSFGFIVRQEIRTEQEDGDYVREILDVDLFEVSPVTFPAFPSTSVHLAKRLLLAAESEDSAKSNEPTMSPSDLENELDLLERELQLRQRSRKIH